MHYQRKAVTAIMSLLLVIVILYYNMFNLTQPYSTRNFYKDFIKNSSIRSNAKKAKYDTEKYLIKTPGCAIPNYMKDLEFKETDYSKSTCYDRIVFVERSSERYVTFRIRRDKLIEYKRKELSFTCAYRFALRSNERGKEDSHLIYTPFKPFKNGDEVKLEEEVIEVLCNLSPFNKTGKIYKIHNKPSTYSDVYLILKKKSPDSYSSSIKDRFIVLFENWNILIVGMDTMSRGRAYHTIPKTVRYLQENRWLDYRGYQKIAVNTFPNIMAILSGKNASSSYSNCGRGMDYCEDSLIWNRFKEAGYMTAFGEDNLKLPDTFSPYKGFTIPPTDHYARPLFLLGEYPSGNIICTRNKPSAQHLLDYALQFSQAYQNDSFFGYFWINSHSHNVKNLPTLFEDDLIDFFENLKSSGILDNTFVFFVSDHGIRYGPQKELAIRELYYEERLPMLFVWVPYEFQETYPKEYGNLKVNQFRLTTPYDLHATLFDLMSKTNTNISPVPPEGCLQCSSLTTLISDQRTCADARVDMKWCSCHDMREASESDQSALRSLNLAVQYVRKKANSIKTTKCFKCSPLTFRKMLRNDWYKYGNKSYYVMSFEMNPGNVKFEATIENQGDEYKILHPTDTISKYNTRGYCVLNKYESPYCVCMKNYKCTRH